MKKKKGFFSEISTTDWIAISILIIGIVGMFLLPYLITQKSWGYNLNVDKSNEIGDTIGGILSPFIGLISAFLIYLALREQIRANKLLSEDIYKKTEVVIFKRVKSKFKRIKKLLKSFVPLESTYFGNVDVEEDKLNVDRLYKFYKIKDGKNVNFALFLSTRILVDYENINKFEPNSDLLMVLLKRINKLLEQINKEIKIQKHLKKEAEFLFEEFFNFYPFGWDLGRNLNYDDLFQLEFKSEIIKFCKLFEKLKIDIDEGRSLDFNLMLFERYNINSEIEREIEERIIQLKRI